MINKLLAAIIITSILSIAPSHKYSTTSVVTLTGAYIKAKNIDKPTKKYKRKDCPVCKGKGWYISGDDIAKVNCGYCEPETSQPDITHKTPRYIK